MKITLAPIPFYWSKETVLAFYEQAKTWPVDTIYLGENVCSKRKELRTEDWLQLAEELRASGKEVVVSTLALLEAESELKTVNKLCKQDSILVEANDLSAVQICFEHNRPFVAGAYLNVYNPQTLKLLQKDGATGWTLPVELGKTELGHMLDYIKEHKLDVETQVMVHGYMPLALSARCFTARGLDKPKDQCKKVCIDYPTGIPIDSQEDQRLFNMNGIQTLSGEILDLRNQVLEMKRMGVNAIRITPSQYDMTDIIQAYAATLSETDIEEPAALSTPASSADYCNGYWFGKEGMAHVQIEAVNVP